MSFDYGPLRSYELTWRSGYVETVQAHQITFQSDRDHGTAAIADFFGTATATRAELPPRFTIHGEIDGHWRMLLTAPEADLLSIRDVTDRESVPDETTGGAA